MASGMNPREYSTRSRARPATQTVTEVLAAAARLAPDGHGRFLAPPALQSWPGIVHGGGLVALLDAAACARGGADHPRHVEARLTSSVPLETPLDLESHEEGGTITVTILDRGQPLSSVAIGRGEVEATPPDPGWRAGREGWPMPLSDQCLACGAHNALGLQLGLRFDADSVWARFLPREPWRRPGGRVVPALAAVVLDEVAWWLGALVAKEGGLTNRIALALLHPDAAVPGPVTAVGRLADVTPVDRRRAFWRTRSALLAADGTVLATAAIVFRAGADYSARQMAFFRSRTDPAIFERMFPNHAG
jgi:acyl-coenzyme A thioesterase PaaI-like protein